MFKLVGWISKSFPSHNRTRLSTVVSRIVLWYPGQPLRSRSFAETILANTVRFLFSFFAISAVEVTTINLLVIHSVPQHRLQQLELHEARHSGDDNEQLGLSCSATRSNLENSSVSDSLQ